MRPFVLSYVLSWAYTKTPRHRKISRIQPTLPTDLDIIRFVDEFWPDLHFVELGMEPYSEPVDTPDTQ